MSFWKNLRIAGVPPLLVGSLNFFVATPKPGLEWTRPILPVVGLIMVIVGQIMHWRTKEN